MIGPSRYANENELIPIATAGLTIPFDKEEAREIPRSNEPPITIPFMTEGTLSLITAAIPNEKKNVPSNSPIKTDRLLFTVKIAGCAML